MQGNGAYISPESLLFVSEMVTCKPWISCKQTSPRKPRKIGWFSIVCGFAKPQISISRPLLRSFASSRLPHSSTREMYGFGCRPSIRLCCQCLIQGCCGSKQRCSGGRLDDNSHVHCAILPYKGGGKQLIKTTFKGHHTQTYCQLVTWIVPCLTLQPWLFFSRRFTRVKVFRRSFLPSSNYSILLPF